MSKGKGIIRLLFVVCLLVAMCIAVPKKSHAAVASTSASVSTTTLRTADTAGGHIIIQSCMVSASTSSAVQFILLDAAGTAATEPTTLPRLSAAAGTTVMYNFLTAFPEKLYVTNSFKVVATAADAAAKITCSTILEKKYVKP